MRDILLTLSLLSLVAGETPRPPYDLVELNHCYTADCETRFTQVLVWNWDDWSRSYVCDGYACVQPEQVRVTPQRDGTTLVSWPEKQTRCRTYRETWTQWDPEILDRGRLPPERRRGL